VGAVRQQRAALARKWSMLTSGPTPVSPCRAAPLTLLLATLLSGCGAGGRRTAGAVASAPHPSAVGGDSAFAALQSRGHHAMGVDQYTSAHQFEALADGGRIVLQRDPADSAGTATIRAHLRHVAARFAVGDFDVPMFVHARTVPGTAVMAARRATIRYTVAELPGGAAVRIATTDPAALAAVHEFLAFQRADHRTAK
jgi:hypothetical protein